MTDTFSYSVTDGEAFTSATVQMLVGSRRIWWVDDSATAPGTGTSASPYTSLTPLNASATDPDAAGDEIFVYAGSYSAGLALESNQQLIGEGVGLVGLVSAGTSPTVSVSGTGAALSLGQTSSVRGLNLSSTGTAPALTNGTGVTSAAVSADVNITGGSGWAVDLDTTASGSLNIAAPITGGTGGAIEFTSSGGGSADFSGFITATGTTAVNVAGNASTTIASRLTATTGAANAVTVSGSGQFSLLNSTNSITTTTGTGIAVGSGAGAVTVRGSVTSGTTTGQPLRRHQARRRHDHHGGEPDRSRNHHRHQQRHREPERQARTVHDVRRNTGLSVTGGGTINAANTANTVSTKTGTAVNIAGSTIGSGGVVFRSVSSNGAPNGINLQGTGSGSLKVTGTGGTTCGGNITDGTTSTPATEVSRPATGGCSGGTIQGSTGAGIRLVTTSAPDLRSLLVTGSAGDGIELSGVAGAIVTDTQVTGSGNADDEHGIDATGGTLVVQDSSVDNSYDANISATGASTVTVDNTYITNAGLRGGASGDGIQMSAGLAQRMDLTTTDSIFEVNIGDHVQVSSTESSGFSGSNQTTLRRNLMVTSPAAVALGVVGGGVVVAGSGNGYEGRSAFTMTANSIQGSRTSAITISQSGSTSNASLRGTISQNTIGGTGTDSCAIAGGSGIDLKNRDGDGTLVADVSSNTIAQCSGPAISVRASDGGVVTDVTANANVIGATPPRPSAPTST